MFLEAIAVACIAYAGISEICRLYIGGHAAYTYWVPHHGIVFLSPPARVQPRVNIGKCLRSRTLADLAQSRAPKAEGAGGTDDAPDTICAICLDPFTEIEAEAAPEPALSEIRRCGHVFCERCVTRWLAAHHTCPLCAQEVTDVSDEPEYFTSCCEWFMMNQC